MELTGQYDLPAPAHEVWAALGDLQILAACLPGCDRVEKQGPSDFVVTAILKRGPTGATLKGQLSLSELDPPRRCVVRGEGNAGAAGSATGETELLLDEKNGITTLTYAAQVTVDNKLMQIGPGPIDDAARKFVDDFFARLAKVLAQGKTQCEMAASGGSPALDPARDELPRETRGFAKIWIGAGIAVAATAAAFLFVRRYR